MYCKKCGERIDNDSFFCRFCGTQQNLLNESNTLINDYKNINVHISLFGKRKRQQKSEIKESPLNKVSRYDGTYRKPYWITIIGVVVVLAYMTYIVLSSIGYFYEDGYMILSLVSIPLKIIFAIKVSQIAKEQNRNNILWGILGFFITGLTMIIIGLLPKLLLQQNESENHRNTSNFSDGEKSNRSPKSKIPKRALKIYLYILTILLLAFTTILMLSIWDILGYSFVWKRILQSIFILILSSSFILLIIYVIFPKR